MMRRAAHRLAMWAAKASGQEFVKTRYGVLMKANWPDRTFRLCYAGRYGRALERLLRGQDRDFVFLDIGANQGLYSLIAAQNPRCVAAVALEPVAATYDLLAANLQANGVARKVRAVKAGLSSERGRQDIFVDPSHSGMASLVPRRNGQTQPEAIELVTIAEVDGMVPAEGDILVKIDVEGHEEVVIRQLAVSAHASRIRAVFYEVNEGRVDAGCLRSELEVMGFRRFSVQGQGRQYDVLAQR
jgi:FkbM family methyltransferase